MASATREPDRFVSQVAELVDALGIGVLLPLTDASVLAVLRKRDLFGETRIPFPDEGAYERLSDKHAVAKVAKGLGIRVPDGRVIDEKRNATATDLTGLTFPIVVKPARSIGVEDGQFKKHSVSYADDPGDLRTFLRRLPPSAFPLLLQERVEGHGLGVFLLRWEGRLLAAFAHRRVREKPPAGGVSVLRESVPLPSQVQHQCTQLLEAFDWHGVAMIEFKGDSLSNQPALMEVNARFWGSLQLAVDSGVNFPELLVAAALGRPVRPVLSYRTGVRLRWFWGDVDHLWTRLRYSRTQLRLPPHAPGRLGALGDFVRGFGPGNRSEVLRPYDPRPAVVETLRRLRLR